MNRAARPSYSISRPASTSPAPVISLIVSIAISVPITPVTAPSTPTASQLGTSAASGVTGYKSPNRLPPGMNTVTCPSHIDTAPDTSGTNRSCRRRYVEIDTTYQTVVHWESTGWTYRQESVDVSDYKMGTPVTMATSDNGESPISGTFDPV